MKRTTPLKRTSFKRREGPTAMREAKPLAKASAVRKCRMCGREFEPRNSMHSLCGPVCGNRYGRQLEKQRREREKAERKADRAKREAMKTLPELIAEAQDAFNEFIRLRDREKGCFVCGCKFPVGRLGGDFDAGHVRSRGAAGHLRFNELNVHGECKPCNSSTGAKPHEIEAGAIRRIGQAAFDALKNDNTPHKWTKDEVRGIRDNYRQKVRELKKAAKACN